MVLEIKPIVLKENQELVDWTPIYEELHTGIQLIKFYEDINKNLILTLNRYVQFIEGKDEEIYHHSLTLSPLAICSNRNKCLILGGGDGLAARTILDKEPNIDITLIELDGAMIDIFKNHERLNKLNNNSLYKCNVHIANALEWVPKNQDKKFDMIILDFPDPTSEELKRLYKERFLLDVTNLLNKEGIISIQCNLDIVNEVSKYINNILNNNAIITYTMPNLGKGKIVVGRKE